MRTCSVTALTLLSCCAEESMPASVVHPDQSVQRAESCFPLQLIMKPLEDDIRRMMMPNTASKLKVGCLAADVWREGPVLQSCTEFHGTCWCLSLPNLCICVRLSHAVSTSRCTGCLAAPAQLGGLFLGCTSAISTCLAVDR